MRVTVPAELRRRQPEQASDSANKKADAIDNRIRLFLSEVFRVGAYSLATFAGRFTGLRRNAGTLPAKLDEEPERAGAASG